MRGVESDLFDFGEAVDGVFVEFEFTDLTEWELLVWPDACQVKDVDLLLFPTLFGLLGGHGLNLQRSLGELAMLDGPVEILL